MGTIMRFCQPQEEHKVQDHNPKPKSRVQESDVVKSKLKKSRDYIQNFIDAKQKEQDQLYLVIQDKYQQKQTKKNLLPLLQTRKEIAEMLDAGNSRLKVISRAIGDVERQQMNVEVVNVMEESNKYMQKVQQELENKDWRGILLQAQEKYDDADWQTQDQESDPQFQALWKELGGDKMDLKIGHVVAVTEAIPQVANVDEIQKEHVQYA